MPGLHRVGRVVHRRRRLLVDPRADHDRVPRRREVDRPLDRGEVGASGTACGRRRQSRWCCPAGWPPGRQRDVARGVVVAGEVGRRVGAAGGGRAVTRAVGPVAVGQDLRPPPRSPGNVRRPTRSSRTSAGRPRRSGVPASPARRRPRPGPRTRRAGPGSGRGRGGCSGCSCRSTCAGRCPSGVAGVDGPLPAGALRNAITNRRVVDVGSYDVGFLFGQPGWSGCR